MLTTTWKYQNTLNRLEDYLLTPVVPGELAYWLEGLSQVVELAGALLWRQIESVNQPEYAQLVQEDPDLFPRVEQLKKGDEDSYARVETLLDHISKLRRATERKTNETLLATPFRNLLEEGLAWVIHAKRQEKARETWSLQAFVRVRGVGD